MSTRGEEARREAIEKLASALGTGVAGHPKHFEEVAEEIVDLITEHAVDVMEEFAAAAAERKQHEG
jgi:fumarate hydratase class II